MWHEARKQEKKIRGMMVDYRKRAERRRDFYEKFKADPTQFLQLHGRPCKIHLDPAVAMAGDSASVMMPWQGQPDVLIDRFDVRAHLDTILEVPSAKKEEEDMTYEDRTMNYERYRILVQNEFLGVNEEKFLHQIYLEEQFGPIALKQSTEMLEKEKRKKGVTIGFTYEDSTPDTSIGGTGDKKSKEADKDESDSDDSDLDFDLCLDLSQIDTPSAHEMNSVGQRFGLTGNDFFSFLTNDVEEQEAMRLARLQEEEKAMFSGRKARRERQAFREKKLLGRVMSPPSYAARKSPTYDKYNRSNRSLSRSTSPENAGQITYITSFGGDDSNEESKKEEITSAIKANRKIKHRRSRGDRQTDRPTFTASPYRPRRSRSIGSRSRSRSPKRRRKYTRSKSMENRSLASNLKKLISKKNEKRPSRSNSSDRYRRFSRSRSRTRSRSRRRSWSSRSRSPSIRSRSGSRRARSKSSRSTSIKKRTRSRSVSSKSHSSSRSPSRVKAKTRSRSKSSSVTSSATPKPEGSPKPVVPRYYGRNRKDSSSSLSLDSSDSESKSNTVQPSCSSSNRNNNNRRGGSDGSHSTSRSAGNPRSTSKPLSREKPQEKLKKKMQALLNRQFRADKKAEKERLEKAEQERQDREAELRDIAIKIRRRERYLRHMGEDEEGDGEQEAMRRRERYLRRLGEEDGRRSGKWEGDCVSISSGSLKSSDSTPENRRKKSRSPRRSRRSRSSSPKVNKIPKRTLVDY